MECQPCNRDFKERSAFPSRLLCRPIGVWFLQDCATSHCSYVNGWGWGAVARRRWCWVKGRMTLWPSQLWGLLRFFSPLICFRHPKISSDELLGYLSILRPHIPSYSHFVPYFSLWPEKQAPRPVDILKAQRSLKAWITESIPKEFHPWLKATALIVPLQAQKYTGRDWNVCYPRVECSALLICF